MWRTFRYSQPILLLLALVSTLKVLTNSLFASLIGRNTRSHINQIARQWSKELLTIVDSQLIIKGHVPHYIPGQAYMIMSNHSTLFDIPIIFASIPGNIRMIAKKELFSIPFFGTRIQDSEFISIDRSNPTRARRDLQRAQAKMHDGIIIWGAPEGTRSAHGELQHFKKGVFRLAQETNAIIIPVGIQNAHHILPARTWKCSAHHKIVVNIGKPIQTTDFLDKPDSVLIQTVWDEINQLMKAPSI